MAIIKRPIRKILFYLAFFISVASVLTTKIIAGDSQNNLSNLEKRAKNVFSVISGLIPITKGGENCWTPPDYSGCVGDGCKETGEGEGEGSTDGCCDTGDD